MKRKSSPAAFLERHRCGVHAKIDLPIPVVGDHIAPLGRVKAHVPQGQGDDRLILVKKSCGELNCRDLTTKKWTFNHEKLEFVKKMANHEKRWSKHEKW